MATATLPSLVKSVGYHTDNHRWLHDFVILVNNERGVGTPEKYWVTEMVPFNNVHPGWLFPSSVNFVIQKVMLEQGFLLGGWDGAALYQIKTNLPAGTLVKVTETQSGQVLYKRVGNNGWIQAHRWNSAGSNLDSWYDVHVVGYENSRSDNMHINSQGNWRDFKNKGRPDSEMIKFYDEHGNHLGSHPSNITERWVQENTCVSGYDEERGSRSRSTVFVCTRYEMRYYQHIGSLRTGQYRTTP